MNTPSHTAEVRPSRRRPGFTLVEVLVALAVGLLVIGAVLALMLVALQLYRKNKLVADSAAATRLVHEYINKELSLAISQSKPIPIYPTYSDAAPSGPARFGTLAYRVGIGAPATVSEVSVPQSAAHINLLWPPSQPLPGRHDLFLLDALVLEDPATHAPGIPIDHCDATGTEIVSGQTMLIITVYFGADSTGSPATIASFNNADTVANISPVLRSSVALIQRERRFETNHPVAGSGTPPTRCELWWYENSQATPYVVTRNVDAQNRFLFAAVPNAAAPEQGVSWQFTFLTEENTTFLPGSKPYFQSNFAEGLVMPKSGNPLNSTDSAGTEWTVARISTTTTTLGTTTFESTTTLGTSTTNVSTTTLGTSTTKVSSTTTAGTSTTNQSTSTLGTSTTKQSTTTAGTSTTKQSSTTLFSTTLQSTTTKGTSTTKLTSTTKQSTTTSGTSTTKLTSTTKQSTTTSGTSTTNKSSTTLQSTTTSGTSTTKLSSTTTAGTSTTKQSTTTAGTSTTNQSTTTAGTSTTKQTTTSGTSTTAQSTTTVGTTLRSSTTTHPTTSIMGD